MHIVVMTKCALQLHLSWSGQNACDFALRMMCGKFSLIYIKVGNWILYKIT